MSHEVLLYDTSDNVRTRGYYFPSAYETFNDANLTVNDT